MVIPIKGMRREKDIGDDNIPAHSLKELENSGMKLMAALANKIYLNGECPKDFLDVMMKNLESL